MVATRSMKGRGADASDDRERGKKLAETAVSSF